MGFGPPPRRQVGDKCWIFNLGPAVLQKRGYAVLRMQVVGRQGSAGDLVPVIWGDCSRGQNVLTGIPVWL